MDSSHDPHNDTLGIISALAFHLCENESTDSITDDRLFNGRKNEIIAKLEVARDENFGGDGVALYTRLLTVIATATFEGDNPVLAIEHWLDTEWNASGHLYN